MITIGEGAQAGLDALYPFAAVRMWGFLHRGNGNMKGVSWWNDENISPPSDKKPVAHQIAEEDYADNSWLAGESFSLIGSCLRGTWADSLLTDLENGNNFRGILLPFAEV